MNISEWTIVKMFAAIIDTQNGRKIHSVKVTQSQSLHLLPYNHYLRQTSLSSMYHVNEPSFNNRTEIGNSHSLQFTTILCKSDVCLNLVDILFKISLNVYLSLWLLMCLPTGKKAKSLWTESLSHDWNWAQLETAHPWWNRLYSL